VLLGTIAGAVETAITQGHGHVQPPESAGNVLLFVAVFAAIAVLASLVLTRKHPRGEEMALLTVATLAFVVRGCGTGCSAPFVWRLAIPAAILAAVCGVVFRWSRAGRGFGALFGGLAGAAISLAALDLGWRSGLEIEVTFAASLTAAAVFLGVLLSFAARKNGFVLGAVSAGVVIASALAAQSSAPPPNLVVPQPSTTRTDRPNVVLLVLDTVRADHMSLYGYPRENTPNLSALARESVVFDRAIASGNYSLTSHASLFTGLLPSVHGARNGFPSKERPRGHDTPLPPDVETLAERLSRLGYKTAGLAGNFGYMAPWTGFGRGFSQYSSQARRKSTYLPLVFPFLWRMDIPLLPLRAWNAHHFVAGSERFATESAQPFFLFINFFDAHGPRFREDGDRFRKDGKGRDDGNVPAYDGSIARLDGAIASLADELRRAGRLDDTVFVVTSDHGEYLGDQGLPGHKHGAGEPVLRIPLLVRYPKKLPATRVASPFGLTDVHRLIIDLVEGNDTRWATTANDEPRVLAQVWGQITATDTRPSVTVEPGAHVVYAGRYKLVARVPLGGRGDALFDLESDPSEQTNLLVLPTPEILVLRERMLNAARAIKPARYVPRDMEPADLEGLRALGYLGG
jgi:arylsulfatase A-like enzyme